MPKNLFTGRMMKCVKCGWKFQSQPNLESMWTTVEIDGHLSDYCPFCWGIPKHLIPEEVKAARKKDGREN